MDNKRRSLIKSIALSGVAAVASSSALALSGKQIKEHDKDASQQPSKGTLKGNINHSVSRWTYGDLSIQALCDLAKQIGFSAIDLVGPEDWPTLKQNGIDSSMCNGAELNLVDGFIHPEFHDELVKRYLQHIDWVADAGYINLICFSGNARGMSKEQGLQNAIVGINRIIKHAEARGVILQMELFNSKIDHPDYMADSSQWGIDLCKAINSPNFKLLYDIYHMQINEGDIIRTIQHSHQYFGHYHTAGVPGRHEISDEQELNYAAIARAINKTGFTGYLAQEFIPTPQTPEGRAESLANAIHICDI